ncbi:hypothetical protein ST47_g9454 [Ascochyta rabiei]|uniref:Uncharacterized protein n=1 Tax=Didymella rabiei TaxID=5454 RepID=A0A162X886_DIDRA|nr:hypothetical protein ST47_g9454 [Ascochyta rabiei]
MKVLPIFEEIAFAEWWQGRVEKQPFILFDAKNGYSQKETGEMLASITPQHVHMVKSLVHMITQNNTLVVGERGYVGLGPKETQVGDMLVVLKGADTPFILRRIVDPSDTGDGIHCTLKGEAYVHGLMHGEAIEAERAGLLETTTFRIH